MKTRLYLKSVDHVNRIQCNKFLWFILELQQTNGLWFLQNGISDNNFKIEPRKELGKYKLLLNLNCFKPNSNLVRQVRRLTGGTFSIHPILLQFLQCSNKKLIILVSVTNEIICKMNKTCFIRTEYPPPKNERQFFFVGVCYSLTNVWLLFIDIKSGLNAI